MDIKIPTKCPFCPMLLIEGKHNGKNTNIFCLNCQILNTYNFLPRFQINYHNNEVYFISAFNLKISHRITIYYFDPIKTCIEIFGTNGLVNSRYKFDFIPNIDWGLALSIENTINLLLTFQ